MIRCFPFGVYVNVKPIIQLFTYLRINQQLGQQNTSISSLEYKHANYLLFGAKTTIQARPSDFLSVLQSCQFQNFIINSPFSIPQNRNFPSGENTKFQHGILKRVISRVIFLVAAFQIVIMPARSPITMLYEFGEYARARKCDEFSYVKEVWSLKFSSTL